MGTEVPTFLRLALAPPISTAGNSCGRQAEASSTSAVTSASRKSRASPVLTRVAETTSVGAPDMPVGL